MVKKAAETAVVYCRTSTKAQKDERTIEAQIAWAKEATRRDGVTLLAYGPKRDGWVMDDGVSGSLLEGRSFAKLIDDIEAGVITPDLIYVYSLSRMAREDRSSGDKQKRIKSRIDSARISGVLGAYEIKVRDESGTNDPNTIAYDVKNSVSVQEYRDIRKRTIDGKARVLSENVIATGGRPPYGYERVAIKGRKAGTTFAVHLEDGPRFKKIMSWYVAGGASHAARHAMQAGWLSPRGSKTWYPSTVQQLLNNARAYLGESVRTIKGQNFTITYEPLIDLATYAAIERRKKERTLKKRTTLLSTGYADCSCGAHVYGHRTQTTQQFVLVCGRRGVNGTTRESCGSISEKVLSSTLWQSVIARLVQIREHEQMTTNGADPYGPQLDAAKGKLATVQDQLDQLVQLFVEGAIDKAALNRNNEKLKATKAALQAEVDRLERAREAHAQKRHGQESVQSRVQSVLLRLQSKGVPLDGKRQVLRDLLQGERVIVTWAKGHTTITLPSFGELAPVSLRCDRPVWEQMHGVSREVIEVIYDASKVEDVALGPE